MLKPATNLQSLADQLLLQHFSPPAVLVNDKGDILYISGRTGKYLEPAAGKANWNIFAMAREGLRFDLGKRLPEGAEAKRGDHRQGSHRLETSGGKQTVDITVQAIEEPEALRGMVMIVFTDVATPLEKKAKAGSKKAPVGNARVRELEQELQQSARRTSDHPRGDAILAGRAQIHQRGVAVHQ